MDSRSVIERFESFIMPVTESGCWLWTGNAPRYAYFRLGKKRIAHRVAWELYVGEIPEGMCVLHQCDVKICVNPAHLFLGTNQDNTDDMWSKGRNHHHRLDWKGENHYNSLLTEAQVIEIFSDSRSLPVIGSNYGVNKNTVWNIKHGKTWKHLNLIGGL